MSIPSLFPPAPGRRSAALLAALLLPAVPAFAQAVPAPRDPVVHLNAFEVQADSDSSYGALNSNSITRFNTELDHMPVSADIFNHAFMKDVGAVSVEDMIMNYSAGAGAALASPANSAASNQPGDRNANSFLALRGLTAPTMELDGFMPVNVLVESGLTGTGYTSNFSIERAEVINGPQSLLYGVGGAGGVINLVSKQARFGRAPFGSFKFQVDEYGHKLGLLDLATSTDRLAVRIAATRQYAQGGRRVNVGGPMNGLYAQFALRVFGHTVLRLTGSQTEYDRIAGTSGLSLTAKSNSDDARNKQRIRYLLATNQIDAAASGPSGAGVIGNGNITWDNVDSYGGWWNTNEYNKTQLAMLTADTRWNSWLSTQLALGYRDTFDDRVGNSITFAAPNASINPTGTWTMGMRGRVAPADLSLAARQKAIRFSALATNDLFDGRVKSQSILGADFVRTDGGVITYAYVKADSNFQPTTTDPARANGLTYASPLWWNVSNGPVANPFWQPRRTGRVTINGQNYVRVLSNVVNLQNVSADNPLGLAPGGAGQLGDYRLGKTLNKGIYAANYTQWLDGKLDILLGARLGDSYSTWATETSSGSENQLLDTKAVSFNAGADYALLPWLRPYFSVSDSYDPPAIFVAGPLGEYPVAAHGVGGEFGVKVTNAKRTVSGSIAIYHANSKNEESSLTSSVLYDINPSGINGFFGAPSLWMNVDRQTQGVQVALTAAPNSHWRMRLSAAMTDGTIKNTRTFPQLYNDQFYADASGQVTYRDGTPVYVSAAGSTKPVAAGSSGAVPLTIAKMNDASDPYYADPMPISGQISKSSTVVKVLESVDPVHGPIRTGATGLPISKIQINPGFTPPGTIITNVAGEKTTGYPKYSVVFTNHYTFDHGPLRGVGIGATAALGWQYRQYYYFPEGLSDPNHAPRTLFTWPTQCRIDGVLSYRHKLGKHYVIETQLNVYNLFNHYHVLILPDYTSGWKGVLNATFDQQPRMFVWSATLSF